MATDFAGGRALLEKGISLERTGDLKGALDAFESLFRAHPDHRECFVACERVAYGLKKWRVLFEIYQTAIELVESGNRAYRLADLYARRGELQHKYLGQPGEAAASFIRMMELDPESDAAQQKIELLFEQQRDFRGLIAAYEKRARLVKSDRKRVEILRRAAHVAQQKLKDARQAASLFALLHAIDPADSEGMEALEKHAHRTRNWEELASVLQTRISLSTGKREALDLRLKLAKLFEEEMRDPQRAAAIYLEILQRDAAHRQSIEALGRLYEATERWDDLIAITKRQIEFSKDRAQKALLQFKCGSIMEAKFNRDDEAVRFYQAAIYASPLCLPAIHGLRDLYLRQGRFREAIETLELEVKLWVGAKERAGVLSQIGHLYERELGEPTRALEYYEKALHVDPECLPANRALFERYYARGDFTLAMPIAALLTQKVNLEPDPSERVRIYQKRAALSQHVGDLKSATESLVVALEIRPENLEVLDQLITICRSRPELYDFRGVFLELEKLYRRRNLSRPLARVLVAKGALHERDFDLDAAEAEYRVATELCPNDFPIADALISFFRKLHRGDDALKASERFIDGGGHPKISGLLRLSEILGDDLDRPVDAISVLEQITAQDPSHFEAHLRLSGERFLLGRFGEAVSASARALELAPPQSRKRESQARLYAHHGRLLAAANKKAEAISAYQKALETSPGHLLAVLGLSRLRLPEIGLSGVQELLGEALEKADMGGLDEEMQVRRALIRFYLEHRDYPRALEQSRRLLEHADEMPPDDAYDDRYLFAHILERQGEHALAREQLIVVLREDFRHGPSYRMLIDLLRHEGAEDRARRAETLLSAVSPPGISQWSPDSRRPIRPVPPTGSALTPQLRRLLDPPFLGEIGPELLAHLELLLSVVIETFYQRYSPPPIPGATSAARGKDLHLRACVQDALSLFGAELEVLTAPVVPGGMLLVDLPHPQAYIQGDLLERSEGERRFLLGMACEPLRGQYGMLLRLDRRARADVAHLIEQLLLPDAGRDDSVRELLANAPRRAAKVLEKISHAPPVEVDVESWLHSLEEAPIRAGLLASDDPAAALRVLATAVAQARATEVETALEVAPVRGAACVVAFYLSAEYDALRVALAAGKTATS